MKSWSPNTLKTRMVLNFKGIPYTQSWISYPDIAPLMKELGVAPNETGTPYTLPAICHSSVKTNPNGAMMDSLPIAMHLDELYPSPPLFPSGDASYALLVAVGRVVGVGMAPSMRALVIPKVADHMDRRGKEYFIRTRTEFFGKPLAEVRPTDEKTLTELWEVLKTQMMTIVMMLKGRPGKTGPFFEGDKAGYVDLVVVCILAWIHRFDRDLWEKIMMLGDGEVKALWDACLPWLEGQGEEKEWPVPQ